MYYTSIGYLLVMVQDIIPIIEYTSMYGWYIRIPWWWYRGYWWYWCRYTRVS